MRLGQTASTKCWGEGPRNEHYQKCTSPQCQFSVQWNLVELEGAVREIRSGLSVSQEARGSRIWHACRCNRHLPKACMVPRYRMIRGKGVGWWCIRADSWRKRARSSCILTKGSASKLLCFYDRYKLSVLVQLIGALNERRWWTVVYCYKASAAV